MLSRRQTIEFEGMVHCRNFYFGRCQFYQGMTDENSVWNIVKICDRSCCDSIHHQIFLAGRSKIFSLKQKQNIFSEMVW